MACLYILVHHVKASGDVPHSNMGNGEFHDWDIELKGNGALDFHEDAPIITYL
jgi:hypothetical protein